MADITSSIEFNTNSVDIDTKYLINAVQEEVASQGSKDINAIVHQNLNFYFKRAEYLKNRLEAERALASHTSILAMAQQRTNRIDINSIRKSNQQYAHDAIVMQNLMKETYLFIEEFRAYTTQEEIDLVLAIRRNGQVRTRLFTLSEQLDRKGLSSNLLSLAKSNTGDYKLMYDMKSLGSDQQASALESFKSGLGTEEFSAFVTGFYSKRGEFPENWGKNLNEGYAIESALSVYSQIKNRKEFKAFVAAKKDYDNARGSYTKASKVIRANYYSWFKRIKAIIKQMYNKVHKDPKVSYRGGDLDPDMARRLTGRNNATQIKFLGSGKKFASAMNLTSMLFVLDTIISIGKAGFNDANTKEILKAAIFKSSKNLDEKMIKYIKDILNSAFVSDPRQKAFSIQHYKG